MTAIALITGASGGIGRVLARQSHAQGCRVAAVGREVDGLDYKAIAAALGQPVNTVKSHIFRAREALADRLRPLLAPTRDRRW